MKHTLITLIAFTFMFSCYQGPTVEFDDEKSQAVAAIFDAYICLLYTSPSPRDMRRSRMPSSA